MTKTQAWITQEATRCAQNYYSLPVVLTRGEGAWLWDIEGKRYVDMMAAYSAVSLGHSHPRLLKVLQEQAAQLNVVSRAFHNDTLFPFLEKICQQSGMDMALPTNTGVEAFETALKAARRYGYEKKGIPDNQAQIIVARNNFHGRTITAISCSSNQNYQYHFGPLTPGFVEVPFGDSEALERAITPFTCAFLVEPIQGEGGINIAPHGWLKACQQICNQHQVLLILDEVQTGLGRTGKWFAFEHEAVVPDGLILGKALGGGIYPVSLFLARKEVMAVFTPGSHGSTFGGNALASRLGLEVLSLIKEENLVEQSLLLGEVLLQELRNIKSDLIKEVRGKGLFIGVQIHEMVSARKVCEKLMDLGVLCKETQQTVIRLAPPLVIQKETIDFVITQFARALAHFA